MKIAEVTVRRVKLVSAGGLRGSDRWDGCWAVGTERNERPSLLEGYTV